MRTLSEYHTACRASKARRPAGDSSAHGAGERPEWLYTVRFTGRELWGEAADPTLTVAVDAWESYLEAP